jgi:predicted nucleic acid-binding protein
MASPLLSSKSMILADTSVLINLDASRFAIEIVQAFPIPVALARSVLSELEEGRDRGRKGSASILQMVEAGKIAVLGMGEIAEKVFEELVIGDSISTLDDGEAETIAIALEKDGAALIDEKKATKICREKYPKLTVICSLDLFMHPEVMEVLGPKRLAEGIENALRDGRMNAPDHCLDWVLSTIGQSKASTFKSLPRRVRLPKNGEQA